MRRRQAVAGVVLALALVASAALAGPGAAQATPDTDHAVTRVEVYPDGSATWTVRIRTRLATDDDVTEFEAFQDPFRENRTQYLGPFRSRVRGTVATAADATGREMAATNFSASTSVQTVPRRWGVVTYRFEWTGFARQDGDTVVVGDVFEGGFFVAENDTLAVSAPPSWTVRRVSPDPTDTGNGTVR